MIYYAIPYNLDKNIGVAYNQVMTKLDDGDYACFLDGDAMFLHPFFGQQLQDYVDRYPTCDMFTCKTNRVGTRYMLAGDWANNDIAYHRKVAQRLLADTSITDITHFPPISGVLILIKKAIWVAVGGFKTEGMLAVDNDMHYKIKRHGGKIGLMNGVYVYHWYRGGNRHDKTHLLKPGQKVKLPPKPVATPASLIRLQRPAIRKRLVNLTRKRVITK